MNETTGIADNYVTPARFSPNVPCSGLSSSPSPPQRHMTAVGSGGGIAVTPARIVRAVRQVNVEFLPAPSCRVVGQVCDREEARGSHAARNTTGPVGMMILHNGT